MTKAKRLTQTQQQLVDAMRAAGANVERLAGGFWVITGSYAGFIRNGVPADAAGKPVVWWATGTVHALIERGVLAVVNDGWPRECKLVVTDG